MSAIGAAAADDRIIDPEIRRFVEYWHERRGAARYPARADLDPPDFRYVMGDVVLIEVQRAPSGSTSPWRYRYRLIGSNIVERDGYNLTNKTLEDMPEPEYRERVRMSWDEVCETGEPIHFIRQLVLDARLRSYEVVVMPLASNHRDIDMLISVQRDLQKAVERRARFEAEAAAR